MDTSKFIPETHYWVNNNPPDYANSPTIRTVLNDTIERLPIEDKYLNTPLLIKNFNAIKYLKVEAEEDVLFTGDWKIWVLRNNSSDNYVVQIRRYEEGSITHYLQVNKNLL